MTREQGQRIKRRVSIQARQLLVLGYKAAGSSDRDIVDKIKDDHDVTVSRQTVNSDWHQALFHLTQLMKPKAEYRIVRNGNRPLSSRVKQYRKNAF